MVRDTLYCLVSVAISVSVSLVVALAAVVVVVIYICWKRKRPFTKPGIRRGEPGRLGHGSDTQTPGAQPASSVEVIHNNYNSIPSGFYNSSNYGYATAGEICSDDTDSGRHCVDSNMASSDVMYSRVKKAPVGLNSKDPPSMQTFVADSDDMYDHTNAHPVTVTDDTNVYDKTGRASVYNRIGETKGTTDASSDVYSRLDKDNSVYNHVGETEVRRADVGTVYDRVERKGDAYDHVDGTGRSHVIGGQVND